jgi:pilus assembly protein CpaB
MRNYILLGVSVVVGLLAFFISKAQIDNTLREKGLYAEQVEVLTITRDMASGDMINFTTDIGSQTIPLNNMDKAAVRMPTRQEYAEATGRQGPVSRADLIQYVAEKLQGQRLVTRKTKGSFLSWSDIELASDQGRDRLLTQRIGKGKYRALSLPVDVPGSVSNMIQPGDHVDILGTFRFPGTEKGAALDMVTRTILQNVTVLAVGQQLMATAATGDGRRNSYTTITLSVTPKEAEFLVFAYQKGTLTFTLRNASDPYMEKDVQDVNFEYLRDNIQKYIEERGKREALPVAPRRTTP